MTDGDTEAPRGEVRCPRSPRKAGRSPAATLPLAALPLPRAVVRLVPATPPFLALSSDTRPGWLTGPARHPGSCGRRL